MAIDLLNLRFFGTKTGCNGELSKFGPFDAGSREMVILAKFLQVH